MHWATLPKLAVATLGCTSRANVTVKTNSAAGAVEAAQSGSDQNIVTDAQLPPSAAITDADFELAEGQLQLFFFSLKST